MKFHIFMNISLQFFMFFANLRKSIKFHVLEQILANSAITDPVNRSEHFVNIIFSCNFDKTLVNVLND